MKQELLYWDTHSSLNYASLKDYIKALMEADNSIQSIVSAEYNIANHGSYITRAIIIVNKDWS